MITYFSRETPGSTTVTSEITDDTANALMRRSQPAGLVFIATVWWFI